MKDEANGPFVFLVRDCSLVALATGIRVQNLREFRDGLLKAPQGSIYYHFWGRLLVPRFDEPEYNNDFAAWARHGLHEKALAERLSAVNPTEFGDLEELRKELLEVVETRMDETEMIPWAKTDNEFHFIRSQIVVFDTGRQVKRPEELPDVINEMSNGSIFYHFIDARRRTADRMDDFTSWLMWLEEDYGELMERLMAVDPYFSSITEIRQILTGIFEEFFRGQDR